MSFKNYSLTITTCINCPFYKKGDRFSLSDMTLILPLNKPACLVLARDMTELLVSLSTSIPEEKNTNLLSCSGCQGLIKLEFTETKGGNRGQEYRFDICLSGQLEDFPPEELLQTLHVNQKTGTLIIDLPYGTATISFKNGQMVQISHKCQEGREAFFELLRERKGSFQFSKLLAPSLHQKKPIGDFMNLFMEGLHKFDEESS